MLIYRAINKVNGKSYVGCTTLELGERKYQHWLNSRNRTKKDKQALYLAINKYGWDNFEWQPLCSALTKKDMEHLEKQLIEEYDTYYSGYNMTIGGEGVLNPKKREKYIVRFPDGITRIVTGYKKFCREHKLNEGNLWHTYKPYKRTYTHKTKTGETRYYTYWQQNKTCKGYTLLGKYNDYDENRYIHEDGSGGPQTDTDTCVGDEIV